MKELWKVLEKDDVLCSALVTLVCFAIMGVVAILCWIFG